MENFDTASTPTAALLQELSLHGYRPLTDETDPRPLPEADTVRQSLADAFDALGAMFEDTRLADDTSDLMWQLTNLFHRKIDRISRSLDDNEQAQRRSQLEQNGSEILSVELEQLTAIGISLVEKRNAFEFMRDTAADFFARHTGSAWRPQTGSMVNRRSLTSAMIDSRDYIAAKTKSDTIVLAPQGTIIAFTAGPNYNDHHKIYAALDKVLQKYPNMVLAHGGTPKGGEKIASTWARNRNITEIVFQPDWTAHQKAAPFKRNDVILDALPIGVVAFPGSGVSANLVDKARARGIQVMEHLA